MIEFTLPWPPRDLSPNARIHWSRRSKLTRKSRADACLITRMAMRNSPPITSELVKVHMAFMPPDRIKRDGHNLAGAMKGAIDGIADALGVDDSRFVVSHEVLPCLGGVVRIGIQSLETESRSE